MPDPQVQVVPEPSSALLVGSAGMLLLLRRRRGSDDGAHGSAFSLLPAPDLQPGTPLHGDGLDRRAPRDAGIAGNLWVAQRVYPVVRQLELIRSWGAVGVMIDGAPIIDELPDYPGFYNVVGANGYTMAPALGMLVAELLAIGEASMDLAPFGLARFASASA